MNTSLLDGSFNVFNTFRVASFRRNFKKSHPTYFDPDGLLVFCGPQGSGAPASAAAPGRTGSASPCTWWPIRPTPSNTWWCMNWRISAITTTRPSFTERSKHTFPIGNAAATCCVHKTAAPTPGGAVFLVIFTINHPTFLCVSAKIQRSNWQLRQTLIG